MIEAGVRWYLAHYDSEIVRTMFLLNTFFWLFSTSEPEQPLDAAADSKAPAVAAPEDELAADSLAVEQTLPPEQHSVLKFALAAPRQCVIDATLKDTALDTPASRDVELIADHVAGRIQSGETESGATPSVVDNVTVQTASTEAEVPNATACGSKTTTSVARQDQVAALKMFTGSLVVEQPSSLERHLVNPGAAVAQRPFAEAMLPRPQRVLDGTNQAMAKTSREQESPSGIRSSVNGASAKVSKKVVSFIDGGTQQELVDHSNDVRLDPAIELEALTSVMESYLDELRQLAGGDDIDLDAANAQHLEGEDSRDVDAFSAEVSALNELLETTSAYAAELSIA